MADIESVLERLRKQYYEIRGRDTTSVADLVDAKDDCLSLCCKAFDLVSIALRELETPKDGAFVGDEGIK